MKSWWRKFLSADNSEVNTGTVFAAIACVNAFVILNVSFFYYRRPLDMGTVSLLGTLIGLGGWAYHASMRNYFPPPGPLVFPPATGSKKEK